MPIPKNPCIRSLLENTTAEGVTDESGVVNCFQTCELFGVAQAVGQSPSFDELKLLRRAAANGILRCRRAQLGQPPRP